MKLWMDKYGNNIFSVTSYSVCIGVSITFAEKVTKCIKFPYNSVYLNIQLCLIQKVCVGLYTEISLTCLFQQQQYV